MSAAKAIAILKAAYPRAEFPDTTIQIYGSQLADLDDTEVVTAVRALIRTSTFLPAIAEIRLEVAERQLNLPTVEQAWDMAVAGLLHVPEVRASVNAVGGTWEINHGDRAEITRRAFRDNYVGRRATAIRRAQLAESSPTDELALAIHDPVSLNGRRLEQLPVTTSMAMRPMTFRTMRRMAGAELGPPSDMEKHDAILVLSEDFDEDDPMHLEAFRVFDEAGA